MKISCVIPTKNEEKTVANVLGRVKKYCDEMILVDSSVDNTIEVAKKTVPKIKVVRQQGTGKGNALREGFQHATGEVVISIDADGSHIPEEIPSFLEKIKNNDMVIGSRFMGASDEMIPLRFVMNKLVTWTINILWGANYTDTQNGFRVLRTELIRKMDLESDKFEIETEMCIKAKKLGARIAEVPSHELEREHGVSRQSLIYHGPFHLMRVLKEFFKKTV